MKHACMSAMMAVVLVVMGPGAAQAQNRKDEAPPEFTVTPAMARALTIPAPASDFRPAAGVLRQAAHSSQPGRRPARRIAGGLAFGFLGMLAGAGVGSAATRNRGDDSAMVGAFYGTIIGSATGAVFGVWLAGK